jgi:hypothetical protein
MRIQEANRAFKRTEIEVSSAAAITLEVKTIPAAAKDLVMVTTRAVQTVDALSLVTVVATVETITVPTGAKV